MIKMSELETFIDLSRASAEFVNTSILNNMQKFSKAKKQLGLRRNLKNLIALTLAATGSQAAAAAASSTKSSSLASKGAAASTSASYTNINYTQLKFTKNIKKYTCYLLAIVYDTDENRVVITSENHLPMIEIDENYALSVASDLQFLIKLSLNWTETDYFKNLIEQTIHTSGLRFKYLLLSVVKQMQSLLELVDLGRVHYQCLKHPTNGSLFFVVVRSLKAASLGANVKLADMDKFLGSTNNNQRPSITNLSSSTTALVSTTLNNSTAACTQDSFLFRHVRSVIEYAQSCESRQEPGLYVVYLKVQSNLEHAKIMLPANMPCSLPYQKIRDNQHVSREEWQMLRSLNVHMLANISYEINNIHFIQILFESILELCRKLSKFKSPIYYWKKR